jgi:hypothetical protein
MEEEILKLMEEEYDRYDGTTNVYSAAKNINKHVFKFLMWYSGMKESQILNAYKRYKKEVLNNVNKIV